MRPCLQTHTALDLDPGGGGGGAVSSFDCYPMPFNMDGLADQFKNGSKDLAHPAKFASAR